MNTTIRSISSILLSVLLWFILYMALTFIFVLLIGSFPFFYNLISFIDRHLYVEHWYFILFMGIPAIIPAVLTKLIMSSATKKAQKFTLIIIASIVSLIVLFFFDLNLLEKLEGIIGLSSAFWLFGKES